MNRILTSESVTEGHPDKVADYIADSILDAHLERDPKARVACEVLVKDDHVVLAGEITSSAELSPRRVVREAIAEIGYTDPAEPFSADTFQLTHLISEQAAEIGAGVGRPGMEQGAGDQGLMIGYATDETDALMPLPAHFAHRLAEGLAEDRKSGRVSWLRPDGKTQVSVMYSEGRPAEVTAVVVAAQHAPTVDREIVEEYVLGELAPRVLGDWRSPRTRFHVNATGSFEQGGPSADSGLTGRKIIVDTYGGAVPHGGGSFSGKDPSKVDRSAAYFARLVARRAVQEGLASRMTVQVAYSIAEADPVALGVDTFGTGDDAAALEFVEGFDFRPAAIIERLGLLEPIYRRTTNYGHFGRPGLPWEE